MKNLVLSATVLSAGLLLAACQEEAQVTPTTTSAELPGGLMTAAEMEELWDPSEEAINMLRVRPRRPVRPPMPNPCPSLLSGCEPLPIFQISTSEPGVEFAYADASIWIGDEQVANSEEGEVLFGENAATVTLSAVATEESAYAVQYRVAFWHEEGGLMMGEWYEDFLMVGADEAREAVEMIWRRPGGPVRPPMPNPCPTFLSGCYPEPDFTLHLNEGEFTFANAALYTAEGEAYATSEAAVGGQTAYEGNVAALKLALVYPEAEVEAGTFLLVREIGYRVNGIQRTAILHDEVEIE